MTTWWRILLEIDNESLDDNFFSQLEEVIDLCDDILDKNEKSVDAMFLKAALLVSGDNCAQSAKVGSKPHSMEKKDWG